MRTTRGFTLVEMLAVVAIVGILAAAAMPMLKGSAQRAREHELRQALRTLRSAIDNYKHAVEDGRVVKAADDSGYPPTLDALVKGVPDATAGAGKRIYFLRRLPRDPFADASLAAADTWALRSSDSPPVAPRPGRDVFDVASKSERIALDGTPYNAW